MSNERKAILRDKLTICLQTVRSLIKQINEIEADVQTSVNEKILKILSYYYPYLVLPKILA